MIVDLKANANCSYQKNYHHKLRGRLWKGLRETRYEELHGDSSSVGFNFSNIFPWGNIEEGDTRKIIISFHDVGLLEALSNNFEENPEFNIGEMSFTFTGCNIFGTDVGEPGSTGHLETATGIYVPIPEEEWSNKIDEDYDDCISWTPKNFSYDLFMQKIVKNLDWKHSNIFDDYLPKPSERPYELFNESKLLKTYALKINVSSDYVRTFIPSKWKFNYKIKDKHHRRILNMALDTGLGWKNQLGLGFVNKRGDKNE